jgi:hypothetical protein
MQYKNKKLNIEINNRELYSLYVCVDRILVFEKEDYDESYTDKETSQVYPHRISDKILFSIFDNCNVTFLTAGVQYVAAGKDYTVGQRIYSPKPLSLCFIGDSGSNIKAHGKTHIYGFGSGSVFCYDESSASIYNTVKAHALNKSVVYAYDKSEVVSYFISTVHAYDRAEVISKDSTIVYSYDYANVNSCGASKVYSRGDSMVYCSDKSQVFASDFSIVYKRSQTCSVSKEKNHFGAIIDQYFINEEDIVVYKKLMEKKIATLIIEKNQGFQSALQGKCRTKSAYVLKIENIDGTIQYEEGHSMHDPFFKYKVGETVKVVKYNDDAEECSTGIHFFLNREEAVRYGVN